MHIVLLNQFFWPDTAATGQLLTDLGRFVGSDATHTTAICSQPSYGIEDSTVKPPVRILRSKSSRFSRSTAGRLLSYGSFLTWAVWNGYRIGRPDILLTLTTPPLIAVLGRMIKLMRGCRHYIWEMDVYPDIAIDLGVLKRDSMLAGVVGLLADWSRRNADGIIVLGDDMKARLIARGIPEERIFVAENWADGQEISPQVFPEGPFVVHYSGTLGLAHEIDTIIGAIDYFQLDPRFRFVFAGGGARWGMLKKYCHDQGYTNVAFRTYCPRGELGSSLAEGHVGLITQLPQTCGSIVPSKTYGIMAAGRPILYIGPPDTTPARIIDRHKCGWRIDCGDIGGLVRLLERLRADRPLIEDAGRNAREALELHYDLPIGVQRILSVLGIGQTYVPVHLSGQRGVPAVSAP